MKGINIEVYKIEPRMVAVQEIFWWNDGNTLPLR